ncbi:MAG: penicillin acylase family protein [Pirellulaceae bacterium]
MADVEQKRVWFRRWTWRSLFLRGGFLLFAVLAISAGLIHWHLRSSMPLLSGTLQIDGVQQPVNIERDAMGVPTITASLRSDAAYALGFVHAQERFFQMDLLRRVSSGRLSGLLGANLVATDARFRKQRFSQVASSVVAKMPDSHIQMFDAYRDGVNEGFAQLGSHPFEYTLLQVDPEPWTKADCIFVMLTMLADLQPMEGLSQLQLGRLKEKVPEDVFNFLVRPGSSWDAALDNTVFEPPKIPPPEIWSLRSEESELNPSTRGKSAAKSKQPHRLSEHDIALNSTRGGNASSTTLPNPFAELRPGSNNWAVSAEHGKNDRAILASDMHLGLRVPVIWYRAVLQTPCLDGKTRRLVGVTLPGLPGLIEGSNGEVAWGLTNSYGDFGDIVELVNAPGENDAADSPNTYMTPDGPLAIETFTEDVSTGDSSQVIEYDWTIWGPVVAVEGDRRFVHHWIGNIPTAFDTNLFELECAGNIDEAVDTCNRSGVVHVNAVIADKSGDVAWTICGRVPKRVTPASRTPVDWSTNGAWSGFLSPEEYPKVVRPSDGRVWTANNRIVGGEGLDVLGDGGYANGARAKQIRQRLFEKDKFDELQFLSIQLDDEALFLARWHELLVSVFESSPDIVSPEFQEAVRKWEKRASVDSVGYRIVRAFRAQTGQILLGVGSESPDVEARTSPIAERLQLTDYVPFSYEAVVWDLVNQRPKHWLPNEFESWDKLLVESAQAAERALERAGSISDATWGNFNRTQIAHPISGSIPFLSRWLDMPSMPLPGDSNMPRVQGPGFGASQRMVVAPGHEEDGIYHQPGGQSAHPYSTYYRTGYEDWCEGNASPLLPGPTMYELQLVPKN